MIYNQATRTVCMIFPLATSVGNTTYDSLTDGNVVDTLGYNYATIDIAYTQGSATSGQPIPLIQLQHSATSSASFVAVTGLSGGDTAGRDFGTTLTGTSDIVPLCFRYNVNLVPLNRYLNLDVRACTSGGDFIAAICRLSRAEEAVIDTTSANVQRFVIA